ncbi:MAG: bacillithiol system redox-active protein YtxJ [Maribacter sp.]|nr:bacillithiol system redox-active protein YtxJ [Maribacter sp.]
MGILNGLLGKVKNKPKEEKKIPWIPLVTLDQLKEIKKKSNVKTQVVFKHSVTCGISRMVLNTFVNSHDFTAEEIDLYYLDLHSHREVSNETGYTFQVIHQSPQLLVIKNGEVIAHGSHGNVNGIDLNEYV